MDLALQRGRRTAPRLKLRLAARVILLDGTLPCIVTDLSAGGARILINRRLRTGGQAVLGWGGHHEAFGDIIWANDAQCGILFEQPLVDTVLQATRRLNDHERLPQDREMTRRAAHAFVRDGTRL